MAPRFALVPARWLAPDSGLTSSDRLTLCVLCQWVNTHDTDCWPSIPVICAHARLTKKTVIASIRRLETVGALMVKRRKAKQGDSDTHLFTILGYDPKPKGEGWGKRAPTGSVNEHPGVGANSTFPSINDLSLTFSSTSRARARGQPRNKITEGFETLRQSLAKIQAEENGNG
jgi:hypothetical protein